MPTSRMLSGPDPVQPENAAIRTVALPIPDDVPRTLEQVSDILGAPYSIHTLRAAADRGELITYRVVGNAAFTDRRFLQQWFERCRERAASADPAAPRRTDADPQTTTGQPSEDAAGAASADAAAVADRLTAGRSARPAEDVPRRRRRKLQPVPDHQPGRNSGS